MKKNIKETANAVLELLLEGMGSSHLHHNSLGRLPHLPFHDEVWKRTKIMVMVSYFDFCSEKDEGPSTEHINNFTTGSKTEY